MTALAQIKTTLSEVHLMDCVQGMKQYPDKYFDLAVVDPPYGIGAANRTGSIGQKKGQGKITKYTRKLWDSEKPKEDYWNELFRVSKNQIVFGANYFTDFLPPSMGWIVYDKKQPEGVSFATAELAFTSFHRSVKTFSTSRANMQNCVSNNPEIGQQNAKIHPTQKPVQLYDWIFKNYAEPSQLILDTHLGSGSSRIAANKAGLDFVGFELDKDYYEGQEKRYREFISQLRMF